MQQILLNTNLSDAERADHVLTASYAGLIHPDVLAKEAAGTITGRSAGFMSFPTERLASQKQMQQNAIDGARAYVNFDSSGANKFSDYLTERYGARTEQDKALGINIFDEPRYHALPHKTSHNLGVGPEFVTPLRPAERPLKELHRSSNEICPPLKTSRPSVLGFTAPAMAQNHGSSI